MANCDGECFWCEIVKGDLVLKEYETVRWLFRIFSPTPNFHIARGTGIRAKILRSHPPQRMTTNGSGEEMYLTAFPGLQMNFLKIISPGRMCASQFLHSTVTGVGYSAEIVAG